MLDLAPRAQVIAKLAKAVCADKDPVNITEVRRLALRVLHATRGKFLVKFLRA